MRSYSFSLSFLACLGAASPALALQLEWPVACEIGRSCVIQHYIDTDPGPGARDTMCGTLTYQGHNGVDIRLPTLKAQRAGVAVLAAAPGRVLRVRDEAPDVSIRETGREGVKGRECGNGLVIAHEEGFETQYCHMAQGSLVVKAGETVGAGQVLGKVGLSGDTEFPHLHFTLRRGGQVVDPFAVDAPAGTCGGGTSLWAPALKAALAYKAGEVLNAGFATGPVTMADIDNGAGETPPQADSPALVAFVRAIGLRQGDLQSLAVAGPNGPIAGSPDGKPLESNKAQSLLFVGKKRPAEGWPAGDYTATYRVQREGKTVIDHVFKLRL